MDKTYAYVALLDVLGYRALLKQDREKGSVDFKDRLQAALAVLSSVNEGQFQYQAISDTVIISCVDKNEFEAFASVVKDVFVSFLNQSLLIRGGISYAQHFKSGTITYSHAIAASYKIENEYALVPRICVANDVIELQNSLGSSLVGKGCVAIQNGTFFLDVATEKNHAELYSLAKALYNSEARSLQGQESAFMKHLWLEYYLTSHRFASGRAKKKYIELAATY